MKAANPVPDAVYEALYDEAMSFDDHEKIGGEGMTIVGWSRPRGGEWGWRLDVNDEMFSVSAFTRRIVPTRDLAFHAASNLFDRLAGHVDVPPRGSVGAEAVQGPDLEVLGWVGSVYLMAKNTAR